MKRLSFQMRIGKNLKSGNSVYQSTIIYLYACLLIDLYFKLHGNLNIPYAFQAPSYSPWSTWSWQQKISNQTNSIRKGSMSLSEEEKDVLESIDKWGPKGRTPQREN